MYDNLGTFHNTVLKGLITMKKYWVVLMAVILLVCTSSICMAEVDLGQDNFEFWAQCTNASTTDLNYDDSCVVKKTGGNSSYMYVKHWGL